MKTLALKLFAAVLFAAALFTSCQPKRENKPQRWLLIVENKVNGYKEPAAIVITERSQKIILSEVTQYIDKKSTFEAIYFNNTDSIVKIDSNLYVLLKAEKPSLMHEQVRALATNKFYPVVRK